MSAVKIGATSHVKDVKIEEDIAPIGSSKKQQKISSASSPSRSGSFTDANELLNELESSQVDLPDINMSLPDDDEMISSLALNSSVAPVPDHINSTLQEPLPVLSKT